MITEAIMLTQLLKPQNPEPPKPKPVETHQVVKKKPAPTKYIIKQGDTLNKVAKRHRMPARRLLCANPKITNPDHIEAGDKLKIPNKKDKLKCVRIKAYRKPSLVSPRSGGFSSSGNLYDYHSCTWWVKHWKPALPNRLGNASNWGYALGKLGWTVSDVPRVGAVAWSTRGDYGHVGLVLSVQEGSITLREGNYDWNGSVRTTTVPVSSYQYIF